MAEPTRLVLRRIRPARNERRFYHLEVMTDLFGTILLHRQWGRIGTDGRTRRDPYPDEASAVGALTLVAARKIRRGYRSLP